MIAVKCNKTIILSIIIIYKNIFFYNTNLFIFIKFYFLFIYFR